MTLVIDLEVSLIKAILWTGQLLGSSLIKTQELTYDLPSLKQDVKRDLYPSWLGSGFVNQLHELHSRNKNQGMKIALHSFLLVNFRSNHLSNDHMAFAIISIKISKNYINQPEAFRTLQFSGKLILTYALTQSGSNIFYPLLVYSINFFLIINIRKSTGIFWRKKTNLSPEIELKTRANFSQIFKVAYKSKNQRFNMLFTFQISQHNSNNSIICKSEILNWGQLAKLFLVKPIQVIWNQGGRYLDRCDTLSYSQIRRKKHFSIRGRIFKMCRNYGVLFLSPGLRLGKF